MATHVKVLGAIYVAVGALGIVTALIATIVFGGAAGLVGTAAAGEDAAVAVPAIRLVGAVVLIIALVLSVPSVVIGWGLLRFRAWARIAGIVLSLAAVVVIPIGTVVGAYGLWVLFSPTTESLFTGGPASVTSGN